MVNQLLYSEHSRGFKPMRLRRHGHGARHAHFGKECSLNPKTTAARTKERSSKYLVSISGRGFAWRDLVSKTFWPMASKNRRHLPTQHLIQSVACIFVVRSRQGNYPLSMGVAFATAIHLSLAYSCMHYTRLVRSIYCQKI
jgi:hypothetical protein